MNVIYAYILVHYTMCILIIAPCISQKISHEWTGSNWTSPMIHSYYAEALIQGNLVKLGFLETKVLITSNIK